MKNLTKLSLALFLILIWLTGTGSLFAHTDMPKADLINIKAAIESYRLQTGRLPSSDDGLEALMKRPENLPEDIQWEPLTSKLPVDPWGNPYKFILDEDLPNGYGIYSKGSDGVTSSMGNDPDDYNTWSIDSREIETSYFKEVPWLSVILGCVLCFFLGWSIRIVRMK